MTLNALCTQCAVKRSIIITMQLCNIAHTIQKVLNETQSGQERMLVKMSLQRQVS